METKTERLVVRWKVCISNWTFARKPFLNILNLRIKFIEILINLWKPKKLSKVLVILIKFLEF